MAFQGVCDYTSYFFNNNIFVYFILVSEKTDGIKNIGDQKVGSGIHCTEWRGKEGSEPDWPDGNYYNPDTGESYRPDLDHKDPVGPHWDYKDPTGEWYRINPDGSVTPK